MSDIFDRQYDVIVVGGGATGAGTARDCAKRGLRTLLVERFDFTAGATGRNHGLLHSGARYAVTDVESAGECIRENMTLRRIASHCVEGTGGLFVTLPEDDLSYKDTFISACRSAGIEAQEIDPDYAKTIEPALNKEITSALTVPDGAVDPFRLTISNVVDAQLHGASVLTYHEVIDFIRKGERIEGIVVRSTLAGRSGGLLYDKEIRGRIVVNASGIWIHGLSQKMGLGVNMFPAKGALLVFGHRVNNIVINRCRKPSDADILVPGDTISLIGTTSSRISFDQCDNLEVTKEEVDILLRGGAELAPLLAKTRILRAYAGVRPLVADDSDPTGRKISRGIVCLDHAERDGLEGLVTITGGKLMTYRLMAEIATDTVCHKLGVDSECTTATDPLPGSSGTRESEIEKRVFPMQPDSNVLAAKERHGSMLPEEKIDSGDDADLVCECEKVSVGEIRFAFDSLYAGNLLNLRRRTRLGMGTCQGGLCVSRAASILASRKGGEAAVADMKEFLQERWKGMIPVGWGRTLAEADFSSWIYRGVCGLSSTEGTAGAENIEN